MNSEQIKQLQRKVKMTGYDPGPIDGKWGPRTAKALDLALARPATVEASTPFPQEAEEDEILLAELLRDEGFRSEVYQDSEGFWTIGIGRLVDGRKGGGITRTEAEYLKANDIARIKRELDQFLPWWRQLDPVRQRAVQNMAFQMGVTTLRNATNTFGSIRAGNWKEAGRKLRLWLWYKQTKNRAERVVRMIETGKA